MVLWSSREMSGVGIYQGLGCHIRKFSSKLQVGATL